MSGHNTKLWARDKPTLQTDFLMREKIPKWLGNVKGKLILDAGCGEGYVARKLAKRGAVVKAFDIDSEMIRIAKGSYCNNIEYKFGNLLDVEKIYKNEKFDIIVLSGTTANLNQKQLDITLHNFYNLLKKDGLLLLTTNHSESYFKNAKSGWIKFLSKPKKKESQIFKLNFYTSDGEKAFWGKAFMHSPEFLNKLLVKNGFSILKIYEPLASKEDMKHFSHMWIDENKVPFHICFVAIKN